MHLLWVLAVSLWMSLPLPVHNYFAPAVQAPNFEKYPFSDAEQYDLGSLNVYYGSLKDIVISKPLYVTFLAILHTIAGLSYGRMIFFQTLIVALFPVVLYLIGKELHSRLAGIAIALFAIMREVTAIQVTSIANVSSTKLLLSDMPAALLASVLVLVLIRWFKESGKKVSGHEFILGGLIGAFILTRIQTMALVPFRLGFSDHPLFSKFEINCSLCFHTIIGSWFGYYSCIDKKSCNYRRFLGGQPIIIGRSLTRIMTTGLDVEMDISSNTSQEEVLQQNQNVIGTLLKNNLLQINRFYC